MIVVFSKFVQKQVMHIKFFPLYLSVTSCPSCKKAENADRYGVLTLLEHEKEVEDMLIQDQE